MTQRRPAAQEIEQGINDLEGHLLWAAQIADASGAARDFAARFTWASVDEREDLADVYAEQRLEDSKQMIDRLAKRSRGMQAQYEQRWRRMKNRLVLGVLLALAVLIFASELLYALD